MAILYNFIRLPRSFRSTQSQNISETIIFRHTTLSLRNTNNILHARDLDILCINRPQQDRNTVQRSHYFSPKFALPAFVNRQGLIVSLLFSSRLLKFLHCLFSNTSTWPHPPYHTKSCTRVEWCNLIMLLFCHLFILFAFTGTHFFWIRCTSLEGPRSGTGLGALLSPLPISLVCIF